MATITKSWIATTCPKCECRRLFTLNDGWVLVCTICGFEKKLEPTGIVGT
jgi:uncharacterized protein (DUF983 family)